jgi:hypothetical protein
LDVIIGKVVVSILDKIQVEYRFIARGVSIDKKLSELSFVFASPIPLNNIGGPSVSI